MTQRILQICSSCKSVNGSPTGRCGPTATCPPLLPRKVRVQALAGILLTALCIVGILPVSSLADSGRFEGTLNSETPEVTLPIEITKPGNVILDIVTGPQLRLYYGIYFYDSDGKTVLSRFNQLQNTERQWTQEQLRPGVYYIKLERDSSNNSNGEYLVDWRLDPVPLAIDTEPNDTRENALPMQRWQTLTGTLGYMGQGVDADTVDYYRISLPRSWNLTLEISTSPELSLQGGITIYDATTQFRMFSGQQGKNTTVYHTAYNLQAGDYIIELEKSSRDDIYGWYRIVPQGQAGGPFISAERMDDGWYFHEWYGYFKPDEYSQWIYHSVHGWQYALGENETSIFIWDAVLAGWLWTGTNSFGPVYPFFYRYIGGGGGWLYHYGNNDRWFHDYNANNTFYAPPNG